MLFPHRAASLALLSCCTIGAISYSRERRVPVVPVAPRLVEMTLVAAAARLSLVPGMQTDADAYNGQVPGPTLEFREGDHVIVHFRNALPESTTVHWHGLHIPVSSDGSPFQPVPPGGSRDYVFDVPTGSAGTYWYHPHPHHRPADPVARGLYGAIIIRAPDDPLPATMTERLILLSDNRFREDGSIDLPADHHAGARLDAENGREGDVLFVNGQITPTLSIRSGEVQRWRIINASAARIYKLALAGHILTQIGTDGGLFERPVELSTILLAPRRARRSARSRNWRSRHAHRTSDASL